MDFLNNHHRSLQAFLQRLENTSSGTEDTIDDNLRSSYLDLLSEWGFKAKGEEEFYRCLGRYYREVFGCPLGREAALWLRNQCQVPLRITPPLFAAQGMGPVFFFEDAARWVWGQHFDALWFRTEVVPLIPPLNREFSFWDHRGNIRIWVHKMETGDMAEAGAWVHECAHILQRLQSGVTPLWHSECQAMETEYRFLGPHPGARKRWHWLYHDWALFCFKREYEVLNGHIPSNGLQLGDFMSPPFLWGLYAFVRNHLNLCEYPSK